MRYRYRKSRIFECRSLAGIIIPEGVTRIGDNAFAGTGFTAIRLPNSVASIGDWAFDRCSNMISVTLPEGPVAIGEGAFSQCSSLSSMQNDGGIR